MNIASRFISSACLSFLGMLPLSSQTIFHNEASDTTRLNDMLIEVLAAKPAPGDAVVMFADKFVGTPYVGGTLEGDSEALRVNLDQLDCTTFAETMMALAMTVDEKRSSWRDFVYNLRNLRYRDGKVNGYPSRLHYIADWAVDNIHRGNFKDVTAQFPRCSYVVKTIDFMSANASKYPALADSANLAQIKRVEIPYRRHRFPLIKTRDLAMKDVGQAFRNGDIVAFTSTVDNLDVSHMGIISMRDGEPYVIHASSSAGKVVVSDVPLDKFVKRNRNFTGVRVFRLNAH